MTRHAYHHNESKRRSMRARAWHVYPHVCWRCGIDLEGTAWELDHVVPLSKGGPGFDLDNTRLSCRTCNRSRGNRPDTPYVAPPTASRTW
jgi:5-methylcytosine-specific restriction endonuclease McrA